MPEKPNFLFIMTDQHRADHVGFGGNKNIKSPHLDAIANRAMVFDSAYVSNPTCMPNRATIATGRMPSTHGTRQNGISLDWRANTYIKSLRKAGYRTSHIGKSHLQNIGISKQGMLRYVDYTLSTEAVDRELAPEWDMLEDIKRYRTTASVNLPGDFYGFENTNFVTSHADICGGHYYQWLLENGINPRQYQGISNALNRATDWQQIYQTRLPVELYPTTYIGDRVVKELKLAEADQRPFFIHCSFPDPHHPFSPPGKYWQMYQPEAFDLPQDFYQDHSLSMPHVQKMITNRGRQLGAATDPFSPTEDQFRHALAAEFGMISLIDDTVGQIMQALQQSGKADNTIVIFSSDHGDLFGDHGLMLKHETHYKGLTRVPLVIYHPQHQPGRSSTLVSSIDLAQTILDLADVTPYYGMQGFSLKALLDDPGRTLRQGVLIEEDEKNDPFGIGHPLRIRTLVTAEARISHFQGMQQGELYDLQSDPQESHNLWFDANATELKTQMLIALNQEMMRVADLCPRPNFSA
ncbi:MAG: sulfatase-like hydrolase/transferase [Pseudomonadales bacterium]|nr:sulfatase-like hydrolase/transferase [Pseudomonadales bacterium]